jgi:hypothetical protein
VFRKGTFFDWVKNKKKNFLSSNFIIYLPLIAGAEIDASQSFDRSNGGVD